jgi:hypothetical protein
MLNANDYIPSKDVLFITLDSLRYDVAVAALKAGRTPNLARVIPNGTWELRHSPATFTFAAHQAFFAGFLPTPAIPGRHSRLFAAKFAGSKTTASTSFVFSESNWIKALENRGYHTFCVGGVGFFRDTGGLGSVLPNYFEHANFSAAMGVASPFSTKNQVARALQLLRQIPDSERVCLFMNVSATHTPTKIFVQGATIESPETQAAALEFADKYLGDLFEVFQARGGALCIVCADHGEAFGEDGFHGHRLAHETVWNVPYAEFFLEDNS